MGCPHFLLFFLPRTLLLCTGLHYNLTPSFLRVSLLIHEWLTQNARVCGTENVFQNTKMARDWVGVNNGEVVEKRKLSVFDSSQIMLPIQMSSEGQSEGSWHQVFLIPNKLHHTHPFMRCSNTEPSKSRWDVPPIEQEGMFNLQCFELLGFPNITSVVMRSVMFYFQSRHALGNCTYLITALPLSGSASQLNFMRSFMWFWYCIPFLNAPLNEFLNPQSAPINSKCGEEPSMINKNNS